MPDPDPFKITWPPKQRLGEGVPRTKAGNPPEPTRFSRRLPSETVAGGPGIRLGPNWATPGRNPETEWTGLGLLLVAILVDWVGRSTQLELDDPQQGRERKKKN